MHIEFSVWLHMGTRFTLKRRDRRSEKCHLNVFSKRVGTKLLTLREIICNKYKYKKCKKGIILHVIYVFKYIIKYGIVFDKIKASGHVTSPYPWYLVVLKLMPKWRIYHAFLRLKSLSLILAKTFRDDFLKCIEPKREFIDPW